VCLLEHTLHGKALLEKEWSCATSICAQVKFVLVLVILKERTFALLSNKKGLRKIEFVNLVRGKYKKCIKTT
jgi:hypothetical protein